MIDNIILKIELTNVAKVNDLAIAETLLSPVAIVDTIVINHIDNNITGKNKPSAVTFIYLKNS